MKYTGYFSDISQKNLLLIVPVGIEIRRVGRGDLENMDLLIVPVGIEITLSRRVLLKIFILLIVPVGIEICLRGC